MLTFMQRPSFRNFVFIGAVGITAILTGCAKSTVERPNVAPVVPGLHESKLASHVRGRVLLGELGCTNCHASGETPIESREAPDLANLSSRVQASYLKPFLISPHAMEPTTVMPDMLRHLNGAELEQAADELSHYLRSHSSTSLSSSPIDSEAAARGASLYESIGCKSCHFATSDSRVRLTQKYTVDSLQTFLLAPHSARPAKRMPAMRLSPAEAYELANHMLAAGAPKDQPTAATDTRKADAGRQRFESLGCANCHNLPDTKRAASSESKPLNSLRMNQGCMSPEIGAWPHYALSEEQIEDLTAALTTLADKLQPEARVQQLMASRNCFTCHIRGEIDGVAGHQDDFQTHDASIGQDGRLPPTLTGVGGKLQHDWLVNSIAHGQHERSYLKTRMPGFGENFANTLSDALEAVDEVPAFPVEALPKGRKEAEVITKVGRELIGVKGMNCITCHSFAGEKAGAMGAIDLVHSTGRRLRPEWFAGFIRHPFRFKPTTLMPQFYPDGISTRPDIADGDPQKQIDAMWHYLAKGRNVGKPRGMHYPEIELEVDQEAVMLRRSVQNTGKRGISVGYPDGVNITFDAETLSINQIWWGRFLDARPVWTGQGSGQAHILSRKRAMLAKGPAFAVIDEGEPWPTISRRDQGDRYLGYDLDDQRRPTFRYTAAGLTITDTPTQSVVDGKTSLLRSLAVDGEQTQTYFRAAQHKNIEQASAHNFRIGKSLNIDTGGLPATIIAAGDESELRIMIDLKNGHAEAVLKYTWIEEGK